MAKGKTKSAKKKPAKKKTAQKKKTQKKKTRKSSGKAKTALKKRTKKVEVKTTENVVVQGASTEKDERKNLGEQTQQTRSSYSKEELEHFKQILLKKREEILEMLESHRQSLIESAMQNDKPVGTPYSIHMEYGTETEEREKTMFFIAREEKMLNYIDAALMRIERGTYGVCISCGKLIDKRRLEAVPHTQLCIECKLAQKKKF